MKSQTQQLLDSGLIKPAGKRRWLHGKSKSCLYRRWKDMKRRCYNIKNKRFNRYGGRGIKVCEQWRNNFIAFESWAIKNGFNKNLEIDRKDNNGDYTPNNCRFISQVENARNREQCKTDEATRNRIIEARKSGKSQNDIASKFNLGRSTIRRILGYAARKV